MEENNSTMEQPKTTPDKSENYNKFQSQIQGDRYAQNTFREMGKAEEPNAALAEEIYNMLNELDGNFLDSAGNFKIDNTETYNFPYQKLRYYGDMEPALLIKNKRKIDLSQFAKSAEEEGIEKGCRLVFSDPNYNPTQMEKMQLQYWQRKLLSGFFYTGIETHPSFSKFLSASYNDFFDLDDITWEYRRDGTGRLLSLHVTDPIIYKTVIKQATFSRNIFSDEDELLESRLKDYNNIIKDMVLNKENNPDYVLHYRNRVLAAVTSDVVKKFHNFTRTDFRKAYRGYSIVEQGIVLVNYIMNSLKMNASNFTNNRLPDGILAFTKNGATSVEMEKLKKILWAHMTGANNRNRFPMISLHNDGDAKWISTRSSSKDMEYHLWVTLLFSIWCQLSGTDPTELSLGSHSEAIGKSSLFQDSADGILKESRDVGIKAFLNHIEDSLNMQDQYGKNIFQEVTRMDVKLEFVGLKVEDKKAKIEIITKELASTKSINQILAQQDQEKQTLMVGENNIYDIVGILNPTIGNYVGMLAQQKEAKEQKQQEQMQQQMQGQQQGLEPGQTQEQNQQLTDADKRLLAQFGNQQDTNQQEDITNQIQQEM